MCELYVFIYYSYYLFENLSMLVLTCIVQHYIEQKLKYAVTYAKIGTYTKFHISKDISILCHNKKLDIHNFINFVQKSK